MSQHPSAKRYTAEKRWEKNRARRIAQFEKMLAESRTPKSVARHARAKVRALRRKAERERAA